MRFLELAPRPQPWPRRPLRGLCCLKMLGSAEGFLRGTLLCNAPNMYPPPRITNSGIFIIVGIIHGSFDLNKCSGYRSCNITRYNTDKRKYVNVDYGQLDFTIVFLRTGMTWVYGEKRNVWSTMQVARAEQVSCHRQPLHRLCSPFLVQMTRI